MPGVILDAFGKPAEWYGGSNALYGRSEGDQRLRPVQPSHYGDYANLISPSGFRRLISESRALASRGQLAAALWQKSDYVSGSDWATYFTGKDAEWGEQAEELNEETASMVCTRGARFDWRTIWHLGVSTCGADGGYFLLLTSAQGDPTWPLVQPIEAHRVGSRDASTVVGDKSAKTMIRDSDDPTAPPKTIYTPYTDLSIRNGIITNRQGTEVAYRVLGPTPDEDQDISARDMIHIGAPRWFSELRPLPEIAPGLMDILGIDMARNAQLDQQIIDSKLTVVEKNETGKQDPTRQLINPSSYNNPKPGGANPEMIERGQFRYLKNGNTLEAWKSSRPSDQWMNYDQRMSATAMAAIRWRLEMLNPSDLSGAATRGFQDQINTLMLSTFQFFRPAVRRVRRYFTAKHIQGGRLNDNKDFLKWDVTPPPEFVVDRASLRYELEGVRAGYQSMPTLQRRNGMRSKNVIKEQANWVFQVKKAAQEASRDGITVDPTEIADLSVPGDARSIAASGKDGGGEDGDQSEHEDRLADIEVTKATADAYGVAVRAGAVTPSEDDENFMREKLRLPKPTSAVKSAWEKDKGTRRPITLTPPPGSPSAPAFPAQNSSPEES